MKNVATVNTDAATFGALAAVGIRCGQSALVIGNSGDCFPDKVGRDPKDRLSSLAEACRRPRK
jgi:hypothetical protein